MIRVSSPPEFGSSRFYRNSPLRQARIIHKLITNWYKLFSFGGLCIYPVGTDLQVCPLSSDRAKALSLQ